MGQVAGRPGKVATACCTTHTIREYRAYSKRTQTEGLFGHYPFEQASRSFGIQEQKQACSAVYLEGTSRVTSVASERFDMQGNHNDSWKDIKGRLPLKNPPKIRLTIHPVGSETKSEILLSINSLPWSHNFVFASTLNVGLL
uniref:Uncharacterized protein n=1 Tax=Vespula pensylvanica TaxID=30213 RepID=A0A834U3X0_VESPE|nr:hypothetical protein H0235_012287 [Vespula pensylvanica]